jgi:hypothetical protein
VKLGHLFLLICYYLYTVLKFFAVIRAIVICCSLRDSVVKKDG